MGYLGGPGRGAVDPLIHAVLDSAPQGFSVWNLDKALIAGNHAYFKMYAFADGAVHPGVSLSQTAEITVAAGNYPGMTAPDVLAMFEERLETSRRSGTPLRSQKTFRGRVIATTHTYMPDTGWVVMHEDITEQTEQKWMTELQERSLATQSRRFTAAIDNMSHGLSMYDADWHLITCNQRYLEIYELPPEFGRPGTPHEAIIEQRRKVGAVTVGHEEDFARHVQSTADAENRRVFLHRLVNGRVIQVTMSPVEGGGFVAVHQDITDDVARLDALRVSNTEIAIQKMRFEAALSNISHGLTMYDAEGQLVVANKRYQQIYDLPDDMLRPGTPFAQAAALRHEARTETIPKSVEFVEAVLGESTSEQETVEAFRLADDRVVSVRQAQMPDGGFIRTHQDITTQVERFETVRRAEREAARQNRVLKQQNMRFDVAINNMSQGLCMFDRRQRLVVCNERYAQLYRLPPALTQAGTRLQDIIGHSSAHGMAPRTTDNVDNRMVLAGNGIEGKDEVEFEDGRTISIHIRPMAGGGFVATHEDVTERRRTEAQVRHLARHDALTDLPNRAFLRDEMEGIAQRIKRGETLAVLCLDLDHFKTVNDTLGHAVGDGVLTTVAERLRKCARETDIVVRLGGDEFAIVAQSLGDSRDAAALAERVVRSIALPMDIDGNQVNAGTSIGIAMAPSDGEDAETLLRNADTALYRAKSEGRGNFHFFERGMDEALQHRRILEHGLKGALARSEFRLMYQPLIDLSTNRICCFEALLRWDHPERGTIAPSDFIPVAEETGLISSIGEWVLREACAEASAWPDDIRIAVNLSPAQFHQRGLVEHVIRALSASNLRPERLELEVTESLLLAETETTLQTLHRLRALGVRISMDDFGTGYSSLSYLRSFPFDKIKIDRTFVAGLEPGDESTAIIRAVVGLGQSLGMSTTAEGIETEAQLDAVRAQGCNEVQGYLFSPPLPGSGAAALLGLEQTRDAIGYRAAS
jgi:diguanylate cyclase (GGDEF)-like protein